MKESKVEQIGKDRQEESGRECKCKRIGIYTEKEDDSEIIFGARRDRPT